MIFGKFFRYPLNKNEKELFKKNHFYYIQISMNNKKFFFIINIIYIHEF